MGRPIVSPLAGVLPAGTGGLRLPALSGVAGQGAARAAQDRPANRTPWRSRSSQARLIVSLKLLTCPGPSVRGHNGVSAGCVTTVSGLTVAYHPSAFSSLLLVIPGQERTRCRQMALDLAMRIVREEGCVSSEKTGWTSPGWPGSPSRGRWPAASCPAEDIRRLRRHAR